MMIPIKCLAQYLVLIILRSGDINQLFPFFQILQILFANSLRKLLHITFVK